MSITTALHTLRLEPRFMRNVAAWRQVPARPALYAPFPAALDGRLVAALRARGLAGLYTHQAAAVAAALRGEHVAVVTPAASGKTLCYNLPVLHRLLADPRARGLYLFPTKALAQDQLAELRELLAALGDEETSRQVDKETRSAATYDGDTPAPQRAKIRDAARIVLSNPDMLHTGILPQHPRWAGFFANLRVVVLDEMHVYRGVFGSHVANVLRRLRRTCRFYGSDPQFILTSATIANPAELAARLVEAPVTLIGPEQNGAPQGEKHVLLYNPPLLDPALGLRRSSSLEAADLAAHFLAHDVQTIVFARARLTTELILTYLRERADEVPGTSPTVRGYRGGYLPSERRAIERGLREGSVRGVVATNALELGIDIGQLEAAVLAGYPGTIASARQQMGRAGRRQSAAAAMLVATAGALDQYILAHPEYLLECSPEHALLNPDNAIILAEHLACAAAELPIEAGESWGHCDVMLSGPPGQSPLHGQESEASPSATRDSVNRLLADLVAAGRLYHAGDRFYWAGEGSPSAAVSLRSSSPDRVVIQATGAGGKPQVIGEVDRFSVPLLLYEGAVYLHEGATYLVERLDWDAGIAQVRPAEVDFYTRPSIGEEVVPLRIVDGGLSKTVTLQIPQSAIPNPQSQIYWGDVRVVSRATGYKIVRRTTNELLGFGQIDLPEQALETTACWLIFSEALIEELKAAGEWFSDPNDYGPNWPAQRDAARARDGFRCQGCGAPDAPQTRRACPELVEGVSAPPCLRPAATAAHRGPSAPGWPGEARENPSGLGQHHVHHKIPFRAFVADPGLRPDLPPELAWQAANRLENLVTLCPACHHRAEMGVRIRSGLGGVANLLAGVAPLYLMCDPRDLGMVVEPQASGSELAQIPVRGPTITIYEKVPGGVGYAEELYRLMPELLQAAYDLVTGCPCAHGCPSCVGPVLEHEYALDTKALAAAVLAKCLV
jgi:DEAD/DEAH box helicase domain-containing protein